MRLVGGDRALVEEWFDATLSLRSKVRLVGGDRALVEIALEEGASSTPS